jgi:molybdopterin converting factor small subunit
MPVVRLPGLLQPLAGGASSVEVEGGTLRAVFDDLERKHPGIAARIVDAGEIRPEIMIAIDADEVRDIDAPVPAGAEVHILPAIAGGSRDGR